MELNELKPVKLTWTILGVVSSVIFTCGVIVTRVEVRAQDQEERLSVLESMNERLYRIEEQIKFVKELLKANKGD